VHGKVIGGSTLEPRSSLQRIKELYEKNINIIKYLKQLEKREQNSTEDIMISYDFQAGSYIEGYRHKKAMVDEIGKRIANTISKLGSFGSLLEAGIGDGTMLGVMVPQLERRPERIYGFDISWSRVKYGRKFLAERGLEVTSLFTGNLMCAPIKTSSIDIVITCHAIEPNGGREEEALRELYRICNKYLVLVEPAYELADEAARSRMREHGYVTNLYATAKQLGYRVLDYGLLGISMNPMNPSGIMIIEKNDNGERNEPLCCPLTKTDLIRRDGAFFSRESLLAYPILDGIPCLLPENAIIATKFLDE
jgi:uncharacterized protein YbaR (Trm112 family)